MSIPASELLEFAKTLASDTTQHEAGRRAAISRAYYAAYHDTDQWHRQLPALGSLGSSKATGMHSQLCVRLQTPDASLSPDLKTTSRKRAYALRAFHSCRTKADYYLTEEVTTPDVHQAISDAQAIIALV